MKTYTQYLVSLRVFNPEGDGPETIVVVMTDEGGESRGRGGEMLKTKLCFSKFLELAQKYCNFAGNYCNLAQNYCNFAQKYCNFAQKYSNSAGIYCNFTQFTAIELD